MKVKEQLDLNRVFFDNCMKIMEPKSYDYSSQGSVFIEIFRQAWEIKTTPQKIIWVLIRKHITTVKEFINTQEVKSEPIGSRLIDIANQMALLEIIINKEKELYEDIANFVWEYEDCERPNSEQSCLVQESKDKCERCGFLHWAVNLHRNWDSKETSSELTQKQLDYSRGQSEI